MSRHFAATLLVVMQLLPNHPGKQPAVQAQPPAKRFCIAEPGYRYRFPADHFSHDCFRTEWWYFTGNLSTAGGRHLGFELTFFRQGVDNPYANPSRWRVDNLYLAHFAVSDLAAQRFVYAEKLSRGGIGTAGVEQNSRDSGRIWNGNWSATLQGDGWALAAREGNRILRLSLKPLKPPVIHGHDGISRKGSGKANASHYYSLTRLATSGVIELDGETLPVSGLSWMDHEFSTSQLEPGQTGWDWVSLQWDDGTEWMLFQLRRADGSRDPFSAGTLIDQAGGTTALSAGEFVMEPLDYWTSPRTQGRYPIRWLIRIPRLGLTAEIGAAMPDQELATTQSTQVTYWEGAIRARSGGRAEMKGTGYLEMTGYAGALPGSLYTAGLYAAKPHR